MFTLPTDFVADISSNATAILASLSPYLTLVLGVLLTVLVVSALISAIKH